MQGYCFKCRMTVDIRNPRQIILKNESLTTQGVCPKCGTRVIRIGRPLRRPNL